MGCVERSTTARVWALRSGWALIRAVGSVAMVLITVIACDGTTYTYSNNLDPERDAPVADVLPYVADPDLQDAILESVGGVSDRSKFEVRWVNAESWRGYTVQQLSGLEYFPRIDGVDLSGSQLADLSADVEVLRRLPEIHGVSLSGAGLIDADVALLTSVPSLGWLHVGGNDLTILSLQYVADSGVDDIFISAPAPSEGLPGYTPEAANVLDDFATVGLDSKLDGLGLEGFDLSAPGALDGLANMPRLWQLRLFQAQLTSVVPINDYVQNHHRADGLHLGLNNNPIPAAELATLDLQRITSLELGYMGDGTLLTAVPAFSSPAPNLYEVSLQDNWDLTDLTGLRMLLEAGTPVEHVNLSNTAITDVTDLLQGGELRRIYLTDIGDEALGETLANVQRLAELPHLEHLQLFNTVLADEALVRQAFDGNPNVWVGYPDGSVNEP